MPIVPALPPHQVQIISHFDFFAVDAQRRRVYAAHTTSHALAVVNADTGEVVGQVKVGAAQGVAVNEATGHVYTGDGESGSVSEVDPMSMTVVHSVHVGRPIDAIALDPATQRIFADEDSGTQVFVVDAKTFKLEGSIPIPGHDLEFLAVDPDRPNLYQNLPDRNAFAVIDTRALKVTRVVPTPELKDNHPLQYDPVYREVLVGGVNGVMSAYRADGTKLGQAAIPEKPDQCSLDATTHEMACAGAGKLWTMQLQADAAPRLVEVLDTGHFVRAVALDPVTHYLWTAWAGPSGDFVEAYRSR